jgi:DNA-binding response OmpR family regulator
VAHVLVVDDEPDIVLLVQINLEMHGHTVATANDGASALESVRDSIPDALVLDVMMPELDGWSVLTELKRDDNEAIRTIPVVMLTALDTEDDQLRGGIEGAVQYLTKPVTPDELVAAVDTVLTAGPEPAQRKAVQQKSLVRLARIESGTTAPVEPQVHLSRLERAPAPAPADERAAATRVGPQSAPLTDKQRSLLLALKDSASVSATAHDLGTSRSNVYASLRRIGRKLDVGSVPELFDLLRSGKLDETLEG